MIAIRDITISELPAFIHSIEFRKMKTIPVSRQRGLSHSQNPYAKPEDKILFLAYEDEGFIGYLGAMPDELTLKDEKVRVAWLSCMWIDSSQRGKGIAPRLLTHAYQAWEGNLLITNFIPVAKRAYDKTGLFTEFKSLNGIRGYLRFNFNEIIIARKPGLKKIQLFLELIDWLLNLFNEIRLLFWRKSLIPDRFNFEYVNEIDEETQKFIQSNSDGHLTPKSSQDFNWMINYPWIFNTPFDDLNSRRYDFSSRIKNFNQFFIKIYNLNYEIIAFLVLTSRGSHMKTPYLYFNEKDIEIIKLVVLAHALKLGIKILSSYHPVFASAIKSKRNPFILTRNMEYKFLISKSLKEKLGDMNDYYFQDGNGDAAFV